MLPAPVSLIEGRPLLDDKAVGRNVGWRRGQSGHSAQGPLPALLCLERDGGHEIHIHIGKPCRHSRLVRFFKFCKGVDPPQSFQLPVLRRLKTYAQAVDPRLPPGRQLFFRDRGRSASGHRPRVGLQGDLRIIVHQKGFTDGRKNLKDLLPLQDRWRSAAKENADNVISLCRVRIGTDLSAKAVHIRLPLPLRGRGGQEVAVFTFSDAERNMDI